MHEAAPVDLRERPGDGDGQRQELCHRHRRAEPPRQRLAAGGFQHQHGPATVADKLQRPRRPRPVQLVPQGVFMGQPVQGRRRRMLCGGQHRQHRMLLAIGPPAPRPAKHKVAILPQDLEVVVLVRVKPSRCVQLPDSTTKPTAAPGLRTSCDFASARLVKPRLETKSATDTATLPCPPAVSPGINPPTGHGALLLVRGGVEWPLPGRFRIVSRAGIRAARQALRANRFPAWDA